jgi:hypothetical protein
MKMKHLVAAGLIALFLYWLVQDPVGAAAMIRGVFDWTVDMLQLIAARVVQFLNALA